MGDTAWCDARSTCRQALDDLRHPLVRTSSDDQLVGGIIFLHSRYRHDREQHLLSLQGEKDRTCQHLWQDDDGIILFGILTYYVSCTVCGAIFMGCDRARLYC